MNDNEIIKALECCISPVYEECKKCPLYDDPTCRRELLKDTLDLINRQQAEIERLNNNVSAMAVTMRNSAKATRSEARKEFAERLIDLKHECGCNYRKKPVYAVTMDKIDHLLAEMEGKENSDER